MSDNKQQSTSEKQFDANQHEHTQTGHDRPVSSHSEETDATRTGHAHEQEREQEREQRKAEEERQRQVEEQARETTIVPMPVGGLRQLAHEVLGDHERWDEIHAINPHITTPDVHVIGQPVHVPRNPKVGKKEKRDK